MPQSDAQLGAGGGGDRVGVEAGEVDAVAEQADLAGGDVERVDEGVDVLGVLDEFDVAERGGDPFGGIHRDPSLPAIGGLRPQPVLGVDHERGTGEAGGDASEDARLRVVGVDDVGAQRAQQPQELAERTEVVERVVRAGEGRHVDVGDAHGAQVVDVRSQRRHADHLVAGVGERPELRPEQPVEAHVGGGDVDDPRRGTGGPPAHSGPASRRSDGHRSASR